MQHVALETLIDGLGSQDAEIVAIVRSNETWLIRYEDVDVELEENNETRRYFFATRIGRPPHDASPDLFPALLQYNMLRRDTDVCLAMDDDRTVVQTIDIPSANMTPMSMLDTIQNVVTKTRAWRLFLDRAADSPSNNEALSDLLATAIRI